MVEDAAAFLERESYSSAQVLHYERVAITREQMEQYSLPMDETKTGDTRSKIWKERGHTHKVELEALAPDVIATLLTLAIERSLDMEEAGEFAPSKRGSN